MSFNLFITLDVRDILLRFAQASSNSYVHSLLQKIYLGNSFKFMIFQAFTIGYKSMMDAYASTVLLLRLPLIWPIRFYRQQNRPSPGLNLMTLDYEYTYSAVKSFITLKYLIFSKAKQKLRFQTKMYSLLLAERLNLCYAVIRGGLGVKDVIKLL